MINRPLCQNFNPRSPCGERPSGRGGICPRNEFQSTLPVRGATQIWLSGNRKHDISIHAPRAGSDAALICKQLDQMGISIHAPRAGSDLIFTKRQTEGEYFNPRSPCGERPNGTPFRRAVIIFQSTLPVRGATLPRGGLLPRRCISIHAPRAGSDIWWCMTARSKASISIHAPRAGSDRTHRLQFGNERYFNPRSPCGERHRQSKRRLTICRFQSTLPVRGAT